MKQIKKGFTLVELLVVIGILGVLMAALVPALSSAKQDTDANAMKMNGIKIVNGITTAQMNKDYSLWPISKGEVDSETTNISSKKFSDADTYFDELFDMQNYGQPTHSPYIDADLISKLSGFGVKSGEGRTSLKGCIAWKVASDLTDGIANRADLPALVSRNLSTDTLAVSGTKKTRGDEQRISCGTEFAQPFGSSTAVIVFKSGKGDVLKDRDITLSQIYKNKTIVFASDEQIDYLKPSK